MTFYIHPSVMFSVIETWNHRPEDATDVIGIILGTKTNDDVVTLHEAHYIQHTLSRETTLEIQCDLQRVRTITSLARSINPNYQVVGWFTTYTQIEDVHRIIHNHFASEFDDSELCLLTVDITLQADSLSPTLYTHKNVAVGAGVCTPESTPGDAALTLFSRRPLNTIIPTQERLALYSMLTGNTWEDEDNAGAIDCPIAFKSNADQVRGSFTDLQGTIKDALAYVDGVLNGSIQGDEQIGKQLAYICSNLPIYDAETVDSFMGNSLDDLQLFSQLALITQQTVSSAQFLPSTQQ